MIKGDQTYFGHILFVNTVDDLDEDRVTFCGGFVQGTMKSRGVHILFLAAVYHHTAILKNKSA